VEAGTHEVARGLQLIRDELRDVFTIVAPCTHTGACGMLTPDNERHWCHFFAAPPSEIFANPDWVKFGQRAGIDLRSLPYAFLAMEKKESHAERGHPPTPEGLSRVIGRPEHFKPYARLLNCDASGLAELTLLKRDDPTLYKELDRTKAPLVYTWKREGDNIRGGLALGQ
jgi:ribosomal protein RSM22 (predicted rRNA methylase)